MHFYYFSPFLGIAVIIRKPTAAPKCAIAWSETSDDDVKHWRTHQGINICNLQAAGHRPGGGVLSIGKC